jgi:hypothetical protein
VHFYNIAVIRNCNNRNKSRIHRDLIKAMCTLATEDRREIQLQMLLSGDSLVALHMGLS